MREWIATTPTSEKPRNRRVPLTTIIILTLAAVAGITYYLGSPAIQPSATPTLGACPGAVQIVVPDGLGASGSSKGYQPPSLSLVAGVNNTVAWVDDYPGIVLNVYSVAVPTGALQWDLNMTDSPGANTQCLTLTVPGQYTYVILMQSGVAGAITVKASQPTSG